LISLNHNILLDCSLNTAQSHEIHSKNLHFNLTKFSAKRANEKKHRIYSESHS